MHRVSRDVQHRLDEELGVRDQIRDARVVVALDNDARRSLGVDEGPHPLGDLVDVHRLHARRAPRSDHPVDQRRESIGFADDDPRVLAQRRVRKLALEQLRRPSQSAERILDLVAEPPHQVPGMGDLGEQPLFTGDLVMTVERHQLHDDLRFGGNRRPAIRWRNGSQRAVDDTGPARVEGDGKGAFGQRLPGVEHAVERVEQLARVDEHRQRRAARGLHAGIEQRFRRRVHALDHRAAVEHQDRGRQVVEEFGAGRGAARVEGGLRRCRLVSGHGRNGEATRLRAMRLRRSIRHRPAAGRCRPVPRLSRGYGCRNRQRL